MAEMGSFAGMVPTPDEMLETHLRQYAVSVQVYRDRMRSHAAVDRFYDLIEGAESPHPGWHIASILPARLANQIEALGIKTAGALTSLSRWQLHDMDNSLGDLTLDQIESYLAAVGMSLRRG